MDFRSPKKIQVSVKVIRWVTAVCGGRICGRNESEADEIDTSGQSENDEVGHVQNDMNVKTD